MINMQEYMKDRRKANKVYALSKLGGKCVECSSDEDLQFDHVNPQDKTLIIANMLAHSRKRLDEELEKCQLLCGECHKKKTLTDMGWQDSKTVHGSPRSYLHCKCEVCLGAHRQRIYAWRKKSGKH